LILTDTGFVNSVKEQFLSVRHEEEEIPPLKKLKPRPSLGTIVRVVCDEMRCSEEKTVEKERSKNIGREMAIFLARGFIGVSCKALGKYFGGISGPAITLSYNHFTG
jgi:chromosomal replication initiation ATPase DnaA